MTKENQMKAGKAGKVHYARRLVEEHPRDGNLSDTQSIKGLKCGHGQIDRVAVSACRAVVGDGDSDLVAVVSVCDLHLFAAKRRGGTRVAVPILIDGSNEVRVRVDSAASTCHAVLVEIGGKSTSIRAAVTTARGRGGLSRGGR